MRLTSLALGAVVALGACARRDNAATDTGAVAANVGASAAATTDTALRGTTAGPALSDANILALIGMSNANEIASSKAAQTKATNADVKSFAGDMVKDHTSMQGDADKLATQLNLTPSAPPAQGDSMKNMAAAVADSLKNTAKGNTFDALYINNQVAAHQMTLDNLQRFQGMATSADLKTLINNAIPKVQQHLDRARQIQSRVGTRA